MTRENLSRFREQILLQTPWTPNRRARRFGTRTDKIPSVTGKCPARPARRTAGQFEISNKKPAPRVPISKTRQDKLRFNHSITPTNKQVTYWKFSGKIINCTTHTELSCGSSKISRQFQRLCRDKRGGGGIGGSNASSRHTPGAARPGDAVQPMASSGNGIAGKFRVMQRGYYDIIFALYTIKK